MYSVRTDTRVNTNSYQIQTDPGHQRLYIGLLLPPLPRPGVPFLLCPTQLPHLDPHWTPNLGLRGWEQGGWEGFPPTLRLCTESEPAASLEALPWLPSLGRRRCSDCLLSECRQVLSQLCTKDSTVILSPGRFSFLRGRSASATCLQGWGHAQRLEQSGSLKEAPPHAPAGPVQMGAD